MHLGRQSRAVRLANELGIRATNITDGSIPPLPYAMYEPEAQSELAEPDDDIINAPTAFTAEQDEESEDYEEDPNGNDSSSYIPPEVHVFSDYSIFSVEDYEKWSIELQLLPNLKPEQVYVLVKKPTSVEKPNSTLTRDDIQWIGVHKKTALAAWNAHPRSSADRTTRCQQIINRVSIPYQKTTEVENEPQVDILPQLTNTPSPPKKKTRRPNPKSTQRDDFLSIPDEFSDDADFVFT